MKKEIDWGEIKNRLDDMRKTIERGFNPSMEERKKILKNRAIKLAKETKEDNDTTYVEVLEFVLACEKYGIELSHVHEVHSLRDLIPLPGTPAFVAGIINLRGQIFSVINLKKFFQLPEKGITDIHKAILVQSEDMEFGILADDVIGVKTISTLDIQPSLPTLKGIHEEYLKGITKDGLILLDAKKILSDKKIIVNQEV